MDSRLALLLAAGNGAFSGRQATRIGVGSSQLRRWVRDRASTRVRRDAFVDAELYARASEAARYDLRVRAVLSTRPSADVASHHAALAVRRLPLWQVDLGRIDVQSDVATNTAHGGRVVHPHDGRPGGPVSSVRAISVVRALVLTAGTSGVEAGLVAADAAVFSTMCTVHDLRDELEAVPCVRGHHRARAMVYAVDPRCESVGESRLRLLLLAAGLTFRSQVRVLDHGSVCARVDFLVDDRVVVEFDGAVKYFGDPSGKTLFLDKPREDRLRELGFQVVRVTGRPGSARRRVRPDSGGASTGRGRRETMTPGMRPPAYASVP